MPGPPEETPPVKTPSPDGGSSRAAPPLWPVVLGVISIVLAVLGLFGQACNVITTVAASILRTSAEDAQMGIPGGTLYWLFMTDYVLLLLTSGWLLAVGIALTRRRPRSRRRAMQWSWAKIAVAVIMTAAIAPYSGTYAETLTEQIGAGSPWFEVSGAVVLAFLVGGLLWCVAWPVFLLAWMSRPAVREEALRWTR